MSATGSPSPTAGTALTATGRATLHYAPPSLVDLLLHPAPEQSPLPQREPSPPGPPRESLVLQRKDLQPFESRDCLRRGPCYEALPLGLRVSLSV